MTATDIGTVEVCYDCYVAHHYGAHSVTREATDAEIVSWEQEGNSYHQRQIMGLEFVRHPNADGLVTVTEWFAGESDQRCEGGEPLADLPEHGHVSGRQKVTGISDFTCSDHFYGQDVTPDDWEGDCETCNDSRVVILADDHDGQGRYEPLTDECPDCIPEPVCDQCGRPGWEDGMTEFTWRSCDGCGSHLGGSRYRLAIHWEDI